MHTDLSTKPNFASLSGQDLVRYNNAMVREILATGLTGYREVSIFQNKDAGIKRCEANWSSLVCGRANVAAANVEEKKVFGPLTGRHSAADPAKSNRPKTGKPKVVTQSQVTTATPDLPPAKVATVGGKAATLQIMLATGATVEAMCVALGWQAHTLRARISTSGLKVIRTRTDGVTSYKIID